MGKGKLRILCDVSVSHYIIIVIEQWLLSINLVNYQIFFFSLTLCGGGGNIYEAV